MLYRLLLVNGNGEARAAALSMLTLQEFDGTDAVPGSSSPKTPYRA